jgi:PPOX class probable F420-dependent enzyme
MIATRAHLSAPGKRFASTFAQQWRVSALVHGFCVEGKREVRSLHLDQIEHLIVRFSSAGYIPDKISLNLRLMFGTAELEAFLAQAFPTPLGVIATVRGDGSPHIVPVWFRWHAGAVTIWTTETRTWVRNLRRDPRVAFSVQTFEDPYPAVMMRGAATVATAHDAATAEEIRAITRRYIVPEDVEGYIARWPDLRTIVTIAPAHIVSWSDTG